MKDDAYLWATDCGWPGRRQDARTKPWRRDGSVDWRWIELVRRDRSRWFMGVTKRSMVNGQHDVQRGSGIEENKDADAQRDVVFVSVL